MPLESLHVSEVWYPLNIILTVVWTWTLDHCDMFFIIINVIVSRSEGGGWKWHNSDHFLFSQTLDKKSVSGITQRKCVRVSGCLSQSDHFSSLVTPNRWRWRLTLIWIPRFLSIGSCEVWGVFASISLIYILCVSINLRFMFIPFTQCHCGWHWHPATTSHFHTVTVSAGVYISMVEETDNCHHCFPTAV